jgi:hypothetical protein
MPSLNGNAELVENLFFLDANAYISQNFFSAFNPISITPGLASENVYTSYSYGLSSLRQVISGTTISCAGTTSGTRARVRCHCRAATRITRLLTARVEPDPALRLDGGVHRHRCPV